MGSSRFGLKDADEESKSISHEFPRPHWLKATGQCVIERYLLATMEERGTVADYSDYYYLILPLKAFT